MVVTGRLVSVYCVQHAKMLLLSPASSYLHCMQYRPNIQYSTFKSLRQPRLTFL